MMIASLVINSIRSALNALERSDGYAVVKWQLKNLEFFVLCARKLDDDEQLRFDDGKVTTLKSLLQRIHNAIPSTPCDWDLVGICLNFVSAITNLKKEIGHWYDTFSVSLPQPTFDEVTEIIDSVLENLDAISHSYFDRLLPPPIDAMIEKITFLRNFILFVTLRSVEPRQLLDNLLLHIRAVAVDAAHTFYIYVSQRYTSYIYEGYDMESNVPVLHLMIKMVDPQIDETYTQALTSSKLSAKLLSPIPYNDRVPSVIMKDFIESLLRNLCERLHTNTRIVISTNFELQLVYEGLRLLRSMLKAQPNKFYKNLGELTRLMICDAGVIIFSFYQKEMEISVPTSDLLQIVKRKDFSIPDLLQRISPIRQRVEGKDLSIPNLVCRIRGAREQVRGNDLPRTNELGFIDFVLENLVGMTSSDTCYGLQSKFGTIHDQLSSLRYSLGKIEGLHSEQKDLEDLWNAGVKVAYRVEFFIDQLVFGDFEGSSSTSFDSTVEDILKEVRSVNSNIHPVSDIQVKKVSMAPNPVPSQNRGPVTDEIVGFDDDIKPIIDQLKSRSKPLKMVAIVGMPGIGKTTLATKVFNHPSVTFHFHVRLQCCVSQLFHKKKLLFELLNLVHPNTKIVDPKTKIIDLKTNTEKNEHDLTEELRKHLKGKRYLIFLDDVWDIEAWDSLRTSFPDDHCESRVLVTSRHRDAIPKELCDHGIFSPHQLTDNQCWELLRKNLPPGNEPSHALDDELGKQIAANCKGVPLTVVVVAGLLANMEPQGWKIFGESISSVSGANDCINIVELSYKHLPGHLKQCFLYFGLFPEDYEVPVTRLIRLWIAEGFVRKTESKRLEDAGRDYVMDLVGRSLVIVSKKSSRGGVKACRIHDLLHDFCRTKAKDENFFQLLKGGYDDLLSFEEPGYMRRLCVHSERKNFKNLRVFCPRLHSLILFPHDERGHNEHDISFIIPRYNRLRVLDINQCQLGFWIGIPSEIGLVLQLKDLSVSGYIFDIPSSIGNLTNLETFILNSYSAKEVSMPDTSWNLQKLRHVAIKNYGFRLAFENLEKFSELRELQSYSGVIIVCGESIERLVRKFPNIHKLSCFLAWEESDEIYWEEIETFKLDSLSQIEPIHLRVASRWSLKQVEFDCPNNLRKLTLGRLLLRQSDVSKIGKLPHLEVLKFRIVFFDEDTWEIVEGEFSTLRFLELNDSGIVRWTASDDQFPCLQKLVLSHCRDLEEIPRCFESIDTLEMVQVSYCHDSVNSFFKGIQDEQTDLGSSFPKIQIRRRYEVL